jgi:predicted transcriptional regulator
MSNKVFIGVESFDEMARRARETARRVDAGERVSEADYYLNFSSAAQLFSELTPARLAALERLKMEGPLTIYALAKNLDRNYSNVHADVQKLLEHELIAKDVEGRVYVPWDEIQIHLSLCTAALADV